MNEISYRSEKGVSHKDYTDLVLDLYKKYPLVARAKITEFKKTFSPDNPFFYYGTIENYLIFDGNKVVGHIAAIADRRSGDFGTIGFFECINDQNIASALFNYASASLKDLGKSKCRGPINISVWQNFRVSYPEGNPPFFLEPFTLGYYRSLFLQHSFSIIHQNITTTGSVNKTQIKEYKKFYLQSIQDGYSYEFLNNENEEDSIKDIFSLSKRIFGGSFSFYEISEQEFLYFAQQYSDISERRCVFILKNKQGESIGFFFAMPDSFNPGLRRVVVKTIGVLPEYGGLGLGRAMLYYFHQSSVKNGFKEMIFSTMAIQNEQILSLVTNTPDIYRKYEVYEKKI